MRHLGIEVNDALEISEQTEIQLLAIGGRVVMPFGRFQA